MDKRFQVLDLTPPFKPLEKAKQEINIVEELIAVTMDSDGTHELFISTTAREQIFEHIGWKVSTNDNSVEQGGLLVGCAYFDKESKLLYGIAEYAIPALNAIGSMAHLEFNHNAWKDLIDAYDQIVKDNQEKNLHIIGWYHTHPGHLGVFMSGTDKNTQRRMFSNDWQFAIVLNPHKSVWKAFYGKDAVQCNGYMMK